jgi:hypothetical protein
MSSSRTGPLYSALQLKILHALRTPKTISELKEELGVKNRSTLYSALRGLPARHSNGRWCFEGDRSDILMECLEHIIDHLYDGDVIAAREDLRAQV